MKLESITVENYRQFEKAELTFDEGITILAGANNSGKTSLINLIKNIFVDDKLNYNMSDIPAKNMREWVEWVYPIFQKFFRDRKTEENVEKDLLNVVIPKEETDSTHLMKMTTVKIHVSYNPDMDDINILCITYTNRAAEELGRDLEQSRVYFGTIHSFINDFIGSFFSHKEIIDLYWTTSFP